MKTTTRLMQCAALLVILFVCFAADTLATMPHGFLVLFAAIAVAGVLATISNLPSAQKKPPRYHHYQGRRRQRKRRHITPSL